MSWPTAEGHLAGNLSALNAGGQELAARWLAQAAPSGAVGLADSAFGPPVLVVKGQSQASRHDPRGEAEKWLSAQPMNFAEINRLLLFGFGSPWPARLILEKGLDLTLFEPDPAVVLKVFELYDFAPFLSSGRLILWSPWHLAEKTPWPHPGPILLAHPPARRREPGQLHNLKRALAGEKRSLSGLKARALDIMVVPPLSGGSLSVAVALAGGVKALGHRAHYLDWGGELKALDHEARSGAGAADPGLLKRIFSRGGDRAAAEAELEKPDLIIALAQAPLDLEGLERLRASCSAPLAFWFVEDARLFGYAAEIASAYDAFFHIQGGAIEDLLKGWGLDRAFYLPLAADASLFAPNGQVPEEFQSQVSFMGAGYPNRRFLLAGLARGYWPATGRPKEAFKIFGDGWKGAEAELGDHLFEKGRRLDTLECALVYAGSLVNLNIHSSQTPRPGFNPESAFVNPRTFEIAAAGGFQLVDQRPLLPPLFQDGKELAVLSEPALLAEALDYYLARPRECRAMGLAARQRVLKEHLYAHRLSSILSLMGHENV